MILLPFQCTYFGMAYILSQGVTVGLGAPRHVRRLDPEFIGIQAFLYLGNDLQPRPDYRRFATEG